MRIILADANTKLLDIHRRVLEGCGHDVRSASSTDVTLQLARQFTPDAVVIDRDLGLEAALELISRLQTEGMAATCVLTTPEPLIEGQAPPGNSVVLYSPYYIEELLQAVGAPSAVSV